MGESTLGNEKVKTREKKKHTHTDTLITMSTGNSNSSSGRSSTATSTNSSETSAETVTRQQSQVFNLSPSPQQPMYYQYYRRQTPEEDYLSTQQGIDILVKQRQQLVDQLTKHYRKLYRSNEIESLLKFSQQIDSIMRLRGFSIVPSPNPSSRTRRRLALPPMERGVTIHDQKF